MAIYKQPKSKYWWYKFTWNGEQIRESTKQTNKRVAEQMEAAHRTALAKGEMGIRDKKPARTTANASSRMRKRRCISEAHLLRRWSNMRTAPCFAM